jgi:uncharacterized protein with PQ loop repeat
MFSISQLINLVINHSNDAGTQKLTNTQIVGMIVGPCLGYIIQCFKIMKERNADGFSPFICLILLIANILRVFWW